VSERNKISVEISGAVREVKRSLELRDLLVDAFHGAFLAFGMIISIGIPLIATGGNQRSRSADTRDPLPSPVDNVEQRLAIIRINGINLYKIRRSDAGMDLA
jgi:hypothetical protein